MQKFRLVFAYTADMFNIPSIRRSDFLVRCKGCQENIPAPILTMPDTWIIAECPLCGQKRRCLPSEIFRGNLSARLDARPSAGRRTAGRKTVGREAHGPIGAMRRAMSRAC